MKQRTLGVKLNDAEAAVFQHFCKSKGMNTSQMLGYMIECVIKMQGGENLMNQKLKDALDVWDWFEDVKKASNVISPSSEIDVQEAIYIVREKGKRGNMAVMMEPSFFGEPNYSTANEEILGELMHTVCRGLYRRLRGMESRLDTHGVIDTITALCGYYERNNDAIHDDIQELFSDNTRHEYGRDTEVIRYVKHNRFTIREESQLRIQDEQRQELQETDTKQEVDEPERQDEADGEL